MTEVWNRQNVKASSFTNPYLPGNAADGIVSESSQWKPDPEAPGPHWLEISWSEPRPVDGAYLYFSYVDSVFLGQEFKISFELQYKDKAGAWTTVPGTIICDYRFPTIRLSFPQVLTTAVRFVSSDSSVALSEFQVLAPSKEPETPKFSHSPSLIHVSHQKDYVPKQRVLVSQYGYHPEHGKRVVFLHGGFLEEPIFAIHRSGDHSVAFQGELAPEHDDFGSVLTGDFSALQEHGEYYVRIGEHRSFGTFRIEPHLWDELQKLVAMQYFGLRRIGEDNVMGDNGDFLAIRWDDAVIPGGKEVYIGRGFADGDDVRRFANASLIVAQYCLLKQQEPFWDQADWIYEQVRWGLDGVLSFLGKDGLLKYALHCRTPDHLKGTDNRFGSGDKGQIIDPFDLVASCDEYNDVNRELIYTSLLIGPAEACLLFHDRDPAFFSRVKQLVENGYAAIKAIYDPYPPKYSLGAWVWLSGLLHQMTGESKYKEAATQAADRLMRLQVMEPHGDDKVSVYGWFRYCDNQYPDDWKGYMPKYGKFTSLDPDRSPWGEKPEQEIMVVPWIYQGLFRMTDWYPEHEHYPRWKESIRCYATHYLMEVSKWNVYGLTPIKCGSEGLARQKGSLSYQYFGEIGRMFHQLANAAFLLKSGKLLNDKALLDCAWSHAAYFTGVNPYGVGCIYGVSTNIPSQQYENDTVGKAYPGGVTNGFNARSAVNDYPEFQYWEYYGYASLACLWFASELPAKRFRKPLEMWPKETEEALHASADPDHRRHLFSIRMKGGHAYRFTVTRHEERVPEFIWLVGGVPGGNEATGTIAQDGTYLAPCVAEEKKVTIRVQCAVDSSVFDETEVLLMPAPRQVQRVWITREGEQLLLRWEPVEEEVSGYTIWKLEPAGEGSVGTIFERTGAVAPAETVYRIPPEHARPETQYMVRAYTRSETMIYGYGPDSPCAIVE